ncbi:hypothetical protein BV25DRAFT_1315408 [Artomyces pyxidatus]|uniref:Uncharacterized protein n=1 Tax=Artomyces pyxidatus TaxID=48021 RepID=A0ACB8SPT3_9AGAM|nr:hypothetical protein BV25DRAFT_1315408 [Artomyces pyxidatus]
MQAGLVFCKFHYSSPGMSGRVIELGTLAGIPQLLSTQRVTRLLHAFGLCNMMITIYVFVKKSWPSETGVNCVRNAVTGML